MAFHRESLKEVEDLQNQLERLSLEQVNIFYEQKLEESGTNVQQNRQDAQGDGDQSPVTINPQFYRDMFAVGGDINHLADRGMEPLSLFAKLCIEGNWHAVQQHLERVAGKDQDLTAEPSQELIRLLETRETALRLSPLLMVVAIGKNIQFAGKMACDQEKVVQVLLEYGARPDARDVCGKTVCHYGMGCMATRMTMNACHHARLAQQSSHFFGRRVQLHGLKTESFNGLQGICKGYKSDEGRRVVYLLDQQKTVGIKPENIQLVDDTNNVIQLVDDTNNVKTPTNLCDIPDRLGGVCLMEVIQSQNRLDVAKELLYKHQADLDVVDRDGMSPRKLSISNGLFSAVAAEVNKAAAKDAQFRRAKTCHNCGVEESKDIQMRACTLCYKVQYCGKKCQTEHWKAGGHSKECKKFARQQNLAVVLDKPTGDSGFTTLLSNYGKHRGSTSTQQASAGYKKPRGVRFNEKLDVKVQGGGPSMPLLIYDKTRECQIEVKPGSAGFEELRKAILAEPTWQGRKTFVKASFDREGNCTVYPGETSIHKW